MVDDGVLWDPDGVFFRGDDAFRAGFFGQGQYSVQVVRGEGMVILVRQDPGHASPGVGDRLHEGSRVRDRAEDDHFATGQPVHRQRRAAIQPRRRHRRIVGQSSQPGGDIGGFDDGQVGEPGL